MYSSQLLDGLQFVAVSTDTRSMRA